MKLVYGCTREVAAFVASLIPGCEMGFGNCQAIGVADGDTLVGGMVFHNYEPTAGVIEISSASISPRWLTSEVRREMFAYPFDRIGCQMVVLRVNEDNERMVRIARSYGFTGHLIPRLRGRDKNQYIFTLTDDAWRAGRFYTRDLTYGQA